MRSFFYTGQCALGLLALLTLTISSNSCNTYPKNSDIGELTEVISMKTGPCFGTCPVFKLTIYGNGVASYEGERFTEKHGLYTKELGREKLNQLITAFREANLGQYPDAFKSEIPDLPSVAISFTDDGKTKSIIGKEGRPEPLLKLQEMLEDIANAKDWVLREAPDFGLEDGMIANELIVQLKPGVDGQLWGRRYAKQGLKLVKRIAPNGDHYLYTYDTSATDPKQMLGWIKEDESVVEAEFNKEVKGRR